MTSLVDEMVSVTRNLRPRTTMERLIYKKRSNAESAQGRVCSYRVSHSKVDKVVSALETIEILIFADLLSPKCS